MSNFTPGPWSHRNGRIFQTDYEVLTIANVARAGDGDYSPANGSLLADAPELLRALADLLALAERWEESLDSHYNARSIEEIEADGDLADEITKARALIEKHRGLV